MSPFHIILQTSDVSPLRLSFEEAFDALSRLPSLFIEPDGSFVWVSAAERWQLDGCLFDRAGRLQYIELKGTWTISALDTFVTALELPAEQLRIQLVREGVSLSVDEFRRTL